MKNKYLLPVLLLVFLVSKNLFSYELGIVTLFRNEASYLKEWIEYHHMLGVDHFILYNDRSDDHWEEVLEPYINSHLVEVIEWHKDEETRLFPEWQITAYKDGLRRSKGNTKWIAFIDVDEFILPKKNATILECLNQNFASASGVFANWRNFGTSGVYITPGEPILMHLTATSELTHPRNSSGKSIVKVDDVLIDEIWCPHQLVLKQGAQYFNGSGRPLYFEGNDLKLSPHHTSRFIQINHYVMRDENFYRSVRIPRAVSKEYGQVSLLEEHYKSFNLVTDHSIIRFLKKNHTVMYQNFWIGK